jgi:hypothetical protein
MRYGARMLKPSITRRELLAGGLAFAAGRTLAAAGQFGGVTPTPPLSDPRHPLPPTWETELKEIAPGVYAYIQAGGPGRDNASVANAGIVVGDDGVLVIDTLTAPLHAKAFISANPSRDRQTISARRVHAPSCRPHQRHAVFRGRDDCGAPVLPCRSLEAGPRSRSVGETPGMGRRHRAAQNPGRPR